MVKTIVAQEGEAMQKPLKIFEEVQLIGNNDATAGVRQRFRHRGKTVVCVTERGQRFQVVPTSTESANHVKRILRLKLAVSVHKRNDFFGDSRLGITADALANFGSRKGSELRLPLEQQLAAVGSPRVVNLVWTVGRVGHLRRAIANPAPTVFSA